MNQSYANNTSGDASTFDRFPRLSSFHFDDFGVPGKLALVAESGAWAWVEPNFRTDLDNGVVLLELMAESGTEVHGIPFDVYNIIEAYYRFDMPFYKFDERDLERTMAKAGASYQRFLDGERRPFSHMASIPSAPAVVRQEYTQPRDPRETEIVDIASRLFKCLGPHAQRFPVAELHEYIQKRLSYDTHRWSISEDLKKAYGAVKRRCPELSMLVYEFPHCAPDGTPVLAA